jgi:Cytochrome c7 and related cytochrome c
LSETTSDRDTYGHREADGGTASSPEIARAAKSIAQNTAVFIYVGFALLAVLPGLVVKFGPIFGIAQDEVGVLAMLRETLGIIDFGRGVRFWLGVVGATMMGLLLLYPLRKVFGRVARFGSVGLWFNTHLLVGVIGPVLILYHCNFSHGGANANVALWSMLVIAVSGVIGYVVYARASRDFYLDRHLVQQRRDALLSLLTSFQSDRAWTQKFVAELDAFEAGLLTPRQGVLRSVAAAIKIEQVRRSSFAQINDMLGQYGRQNTLTRRDFERLAAPVVQHVQAYFSLSRSASSRSLVEQIWARWRLFHLPVFLVMVVAIVLHVVAVWDMEPSVKVEPALKVQPQAALIEQQRASEPTVDVIDELLRKTGQIESGAESRSENEAMPAASGSQPALTRLPRLVTLRPKIVEGVKVKVVGSISVGSNADAAQTQTQAQTQAAAIASTASRKSLEPTENVINDAKRQPEPSRPVEALSAAMGLGLAKMRTLPEQIASLKRLKQLNEFTHSEMETGFLLAGKHLKAECTSCHTEAFVETGHETGQKTGQKTGHKTPRKCVDCHKTDDVHKGRQPDCAQCHTANRWSQILRRKP